MEVASDIHAVLCQSRPARRLVLCGLARASIEDDAWSRQRSSPAECRDEPVLSDEFQQRGIPKVVPAFENDVLIHRFGCCASSAHANRKRRHTLSRISTAQRNIAFQFAVGAANQSVGKALVSMCRFNATQLGNPYSRAMVSWAHWGAEMGAVKDFSVRSPAETWVKFP